MLQTECSSDRLATCETLFQMMGLSETDLHTHFTIGQGFGFSSFIVSHNHFCHFFYNTINDFQEKAFRRVHSYQHLRFILHPPAHPDTLQLIGIYTVCKKSADTDSVIQCLRSLSVFYNLTNLCSISCRWSRFSHLQYLGVGKSYITEYRQYMHSR